MRIKSGGGIQSRQVSHRHEPKVEPKAHKANVASGAQQGLSTQFPKAPLQQGPGSGYEPKPMGPTGVPGKYNAATSLVVAAQFIVAAVRARTALLILVKSTVHLIPLRRVRQAATFYRITALRFGGRRWQGSAQLNPSTVMRLELAVSVLAEL